MQGSNLSTPCRCGGVLAFCCQPTIHCPWWQYMTKFEACMSLHCNVVSPMPKNRKPFLSSANGFQSFCPSLQHLKEKSQLRRILFYFSWNRQHLISKCIRLSRYWFMKIVILIVPAELLNAVWNVKKELIITRKWTLEHFIQHVNFS